MSKLVVKLRICKPREDGRIYATFLTARVCVVNGQEIEQIRHWMLIGRQVEVLAWT